MQPYREEIAVNLICSVILGYEVFFQQPPNGRDDRTGGHEVILTHKLGCWIYFLTSSIFDN